MAFLDALHLNCECYTTHELWHIFCKMRDPQGGFHCMMKLWRASLVSPSSIVARVRERERERERERVFMKQVTMVL